MLASAAAAKREHDQSQLDYLELLLAQKRKATAADSSVVFGF